MHVIILLDEATKRLAKDEVVYGSDRLLIRLHSPLYTNERDCILGVTSMSLSQRPEFSAHPLTEERSMPLSRISSLDLMETIAIIMACSLHYPLFPVGSYLSEIWQLLCMGAVPSFFIINGYLLFSRPFSWHKHASRLKKVVLGVMLWKTLILAAFSLVGTFDIRMLTPELLFDYYCTSITLSGLPAEHIWFMYALLSIYILFPLFKLMFDAGLKRYIVFVIALGMVTVPFAIDVDWALSAATCPIGVSFQPSLKVSETLSTLFPFGPWGIYLVYFLIGPFAWPAIESFAEKKGVFKLGVVAVGLILASVAVALLQDWVYHGAATWVGSVIPEQYKHIATIGVSLGLLAASRSIPLSSGFKKLVALISQNTITIYYLHMPLLFILTISFSWPNSFAFSLVRTIGVVALSTAIGIIMKRVPVIRALS